MLFQFLLVVHAIIAALLVGVILVQKSEGGGLGMGGSPSGLMSARGAADFLTRATTVLATLFVALSIGLAVLAARGHTAKIDTTLAHGTPAPAAQLPVPSAPADDAVPFSSAARQAIGNNAAPVAPAPADNNSVPLAK